MSDLANVAQILVRAREVLARVGRGPAALNLVKRREVIAICVPARIAKAVVAGEVKAVLKRQVFEVEGREFVLADDALAYGDVVLRNPIRLARGQAALRGADHGLTTADLDLYWPGAAALHLYEVEEFLPYDAPRPVHSASLVATHKRLMQGDTQLFGMTGLHIHAVDRESGGTLVDGLHYHAFHIGGELLLTAEDGGHRHARGEDSLRVAEGGQHGHVLRLPDGREFRTSQDGPHGHDLTVGTTGVDGAHGHTVEIDATVYKSLSPAEIAALLPEGAPQMSSAPPSSWIAKRIEGRDGSMVEPVEPAPQLVSKPFSSFPNFAACVTEMVRDGGYTEESARRICGKLQAEHEAKPKHKRADTTREFLAAVRARRLIGRDLAQVVLAVQVDAAAAWAGGYRESERDYTAVGQMVLPSDVECDPGRVLAVKAESLLLTTTAPRTLRAFGLALARSPEETAQRAPSTADHLITLLRDGEAREEAHFFDAHRDRAVRLISKRAPGAPEQAEGEIEEERFVLGIVLEPDAPDAQGHIYGPAEVRRAAHYFMEFHRTQAFMHRAVLDNESTILESYVAPSDLTIDGQYVPKGTWLLAARVYDDKLWDMIKNGQLTAWSIGGWGILDAVQKGAA